MNRQYKNIKIVLTIVIISLVANLFPIFGKKLGNLSQVGIPAQIMVDNDQLYVTDQKIKIHLYSLKNFKYIKSFSNRGEGPGEFKVVPRLKIYPDYLFLYGFLKIMRVSRNLQYIDEFKTSKHFRYIYPVGSNYVGFSGGLNQKTEMYYSEICIYTRDKDLKYKKLIYYLENIPVVKPGQKEDSPMLSETHSFIVYKDRIYIGDPTRGLFVQVFDSNGNKLYQINLNYEKKKVTEEFKQEWMRERWPDLSRWEAYKKTCNPYFQDYFPPFLKFEVKNDKIYFFTYNRKGTDSEVIVTDLKGKILRKAYVPHSRNRSGFDFTVDNDKYYYIVDNEETEEWELHAVDIK